MTDHLRGLEEAEATPRGPALDRIRAAWGRRKWLGILAFILPLTVAATIVMALPDLYQSTALVLVERQQVPEAFVRPTVTSELEVRLQTISQEILSRSRLEALISRFGLYPDLAGRPSTDEAIERLRRDVRLELQAADTRRGGTTIAFALSYRGRDPQTVALVTNTLASFYIEENLKARERQATGTAEFLKVQLVEAKKRLDEQEARVSEFRRRYLGQLPQQMQSNLAAIESLNAQLRMTSDNQVRLGERRDQLAAQLAQAKAETNPDTDEMRLARLRQELTTLRMRFTDRWPDIIRIKDEIARLEKHLAEPKPKADPATTPPSPPTPQVMRLQEALRSIDTELKLAKADEQRVRRALDLYQARVENIPKNEQEYLVLTRDYDATRELYSTLLKRYDEAQLAESMEQRQKGEQFRILDAALPASTPAAPRRSRLLLASLALSVALGAGAMVLAEMLDTSFHSLQDLRAYTTVPVLVSIPRILTEDDVRRAQRRFRLAAVGALFSLALLAGASYLLAHGNEPLAQLLSRDRA